MGAASPTAKIVFESNRDGTVQIYVMNSDGSNVIRLTDRPGMSMSPAVSPDGHMIAFRSDRDGTDQIYIMHADGSHVVRLTSPRWRRGSRHSARMAGALRSLVINVGNCRST